MPAVITGFVAALHVGALVVAMPISEHPGAPPRDQTHGMTTTDAWCLDDFPDVDQTQSLELEDSNLTGTKAGEEELLELERVEVAIVVEQLKDDQVALCEGSVEFAELCLGGTSVGLSGKVSKNYWMS